MQEWENGDWMEQKEGALIVHFAGPRKVLSTAPLNGGYHEDLTAVFNHGGEKEGIMKADTYEGHVGVIAGELGLSAETASGFSTAADMQNAAVICERFRRIAVTAIVTGGIDINGGRAGDPAFWDEQDGSTVYLPGTINILLLIHADLTEGALAKALMTCADARCTAVRELMLPSRYSTGLATGSGTDGAILVSDSQSPVKLADAGYHFKLGELIGRAVIRAVKLALKRQTLRDAETQKDVFVRLERFGFTPSAVNFLSDPDCSRALEVFRADRENVVRASLCAHLLDQVRCGLLAREEILDMWGSLVKGLHIPDEGCCKNNVRKGLDKLINDPELSGIHTEE